MANFITDLHQCSPVYFVAEIVFFFFKIAESMLDPTVRLYIYEVVCRMEYSNDTTCYNLPENPDRETHVQELSANYIILYKVLLNLPAILLGLFCGAWSDVVGRKLPVIITAMGTILAVLLYMSSLLVVITSALVLVFVGATIRGGFGKSAVMTMALHSYVSDISTKEDRTKKLGKLLAMNFFGYFVGSLLAGALFEVSHFDVVFSCVIGFNAICIVITIVFMRESAPSLKEEAEVDNDADVKDKPHKPIPFKWSHVKESIQVLTKERPHRRRLHIIILFFTIILHQAAKSGEVDVTMLFVERAPLYWRKSMYGYYLATDYACLGLAVFILLPLIIRFRKVDDIFLVMLGIFFKILRSLLLAFSTKTWMVFLSVVIGCPSAMIISGVKSIISKSVNEDEMGKTFSLLSCGETISNLLGSLIFTSIYASTQKVYPGLTYIVVAILFILLFVLVLLIAMDMRLANQYNILKGLLGDRMDYGATCHAGTGSETGLTASEVVTPTSERSEPLPIAPPTPELLTASHTSGKGTINIKRIRSFSRNSDSDSEMENSPTK